MSVMLTQNHFQKNWKKILNQQLLGSKKELNANKCNLIVSERKYEHVCFKLGKNKIQESNNVKLLAVKTDNELKFDEHIFNVCLKSNRKLSVLIRLSRFPSLEKLRTFKYCP